MGETMAVHIANNGFGFGTKIGAMNQRHCVNCRLPGLATELEALENYLGWLVQVLGSEYLELQVFSLGDKVSFTGRIEDL